MSLIQRGLNLVNHVQNTVQNTVDKAQNTVSNVGNTVRQGVEQGGRKLGQFVDGFEDQVAQKAGFVGDLLGGNKADLVHDGKLVGAGGQTFAPGTPLSQIPGVTPKDNPNPSETILYVNGIGDTKDKQFGSLQQIADTTGAKIIGVHNATEGMVADVAQCVKDKLDKGTNPAVDTMADTIYAELKAGRSVHVMGHSQGGLILSRALGDVANRLRIEDGLSQADAEKLLGKVNVETFGAAAGKYPDGPNYVHYVNDKDLVPTMFGLGDGDSPLDFTRDAGRGAVVHHYEYGDGMSGTHRLDQAYLPFRVPFDEARAGQF
ncbi:hypothetical protein [Hyalangium rubrum]|uniref:DUF676 domain-containing protein n=1 Tax=Hyalangium rubrum TaxID=3103134 RepID=A0ABU5HIG7_9BACT|nr:hypothetical protein [Hyalangium sp. s54d21]MDY7233268.1 hypothetical protein [Hyalangium sp. s54d21]